MKLRAVDLVWWLLLAATALTWGMSHSGWLAGAGLGGMAVVFALAWIKGLGVILEFMELRHAPAGWRWALIGGLTLIVLLILLAYAVARP